MAFTKITYSPGDVLTSEQMNNIQDVIIKNEGNIEHHITNQNNPHNVTPQQIGAAPSFESGITTLSSHQYGNELPTAGTKGRIFFRKA